MLRLKKLIFFVCLQIIVTHVFANNIIVSNVGLVGRDISAGSNNPANFAFIKFDLSWENSWRTSSEPNNWDAAWIFVKYHVGSGVWKHATLHTSLHTAPTGSTISTSSDAKGVFIYRNTDGSGNVSYPGVKLRWDYRTDGVLDTDRVVVKVLAIEMVYVPQGTFHVGSGGTESGSFTDGAWRSGATLKFQITSEAALTVDSSAGCLWGTSTSGTNTIGSVGTLSANFPKGYNAFYSMKYSISQGEYVDFLNTLTYQQQVSRTAAAPNSAVGTKAMYTVGQFSHRNGIEIQTSGIFPTSPAVYACDLHDDDIFNQSDDGQDVECNYLSWADGIAYSDWASLRPMSELEFEKACRGFVDTSAYEVNELVWGDTSAVQDTSIVHSGMEDETVLPDLANSNFNHTKNVAEGGPIRVGIFARSTTTRSQSGSAYFGIMDMGGNVWERTITVGDSIGRLFSGSHGDGNLDMDGSAIDVLDWPADNAIGAGFRGGVWDVSVSSMQISDRSVTSLVSLERGGNLNNVGTRGFRAVRTAP
jgi:formylglycine-generating enzyme required for sulfatase activity